jgi:hypothetical protein
MMFLVTEVHPFMDGNGRTARLMMNAELVSAGESRIIVPAVYLNNYLVALKALSQKGITGALPRMLDFAQRYTAAVDFSKLERAASSSTAPTPSPIRAKRIPAASAWCCLRPASWPMPRNSTLRYRYRPATKKRRGFRNRKATSARPIMRGIQWDPR